MSALTSPQRPVYLDYNATTPVSPEVVSAMAPFWTTYFYNPSATYPEAMAGHAAIENARQSVTTLLGADPQSIVFTSGGTESNNWVLRAVWEARPPDRDRVIISAIEHPAVTATAAALATLGADVVTIPVDAHGVVRLSDLDAALDERTVLVSVMLANNEIGTIQPVADVARRAHAVGALVHTDAAQAVGKIPVNVQSLDVDFLSVAGHKFCAPKGIGALYIRPGVTLPPLITGGGQQGGYRSGTEPVALIVGLGKAAELAEVWIRHGGMEQLTELRTRLEMGLIAIDPHLTIFGREAERLPNTVAFAHPDWPGSSLLVATPLIRAGTGSACHHPSDAGSPTLMAMGVSPRLRQGLVRLSFGRETTVADLDAAIKALSEVLNAEPPQPRKFSS
ncbi:MAG: cysteine desulfurase family protein [Firmicutes bacterium]|nr:cysteine desulfurase family protein [Bacillota bacterium]